MEASIDSTLLFIDPLMVAVIMTILYHEKFTWLTGACLVTAGTGLALLYNGKPDSSLSITGLAWVIGSALSYAIVLVGINRSALATMPSNRMTFYLLLFGALIFIIPAVAYKQVIVPNDNRLWMCVLALGLLPTALSLA